MTTATTIALVALIVSILVWLFGRGIYWRFQDVPKLRWIEQADYRFSSDNIISGIRVENRGNKTAHDVAIRIRNKPDEPYLSVAVESDEDYEVKEGGENESYIRLWLQRMVPGEAITVNFATARPVEKTVTILSEEGKGQPAETQERLLWRSQVVVALIAALASIIAGVLQASELVPKLAEWLAQFLSP
jgi:hypothetical protein